MLAPTPRDVILCDAGAQLLRFRRAGDGVDSRATPAPPVLLVPSLINRWYVLDLRPSASLAGALVEAGLDVWCLDWGVPGDEDRYLTWEDVLARLARAVRAVRSRTGGSPISLLGYCMGGTLCGIHAALQPGTINRLVNLLGPFDFAHAGFLGTMTDARWFDPAAIAAAGNIGANQMQAGFTALRPTQQIAGQDDQYLDRSRRSAARESFAALEEWAGDNVAFPGAAYVTYITELYQQNRLVGGSHHVGGKRVDLGQIRCPVLTIAADRDAICPPAAASALNDNVGSAVRELVSVPGGHVGAVVGGRAAAQLYPKLASWLGQPFGG